MTSKSVPEKKIMPEGTQGEVQTQTGYVQEVKVGFSLSFAYAARK